jgi:RNA polymerase sigma-70 factor (sigma-E family)
MNDRPRFEDRFDVLAAVAHRVAYRLLGNRAEAEEVAQEALERAYARWRSVADHDEPWVARVATNLAIGRWRKRRPTVPLAEADGRPAHPPDDAAVLAFQRQALVGGLKALSRRQREVVVLRYLADMPEAAVAAALGTSVGTVKTHASRGLSHLRADLAGLADLAPGPPSAPSLLTPEVDDVRAPR